MQKPCFPQPHAVNPAPLRCNSSLTQAVHRLSRARLTWRRLCSQQDLALSGRELKYRTTRAPLVKAMQTLRAVPLGTGRRERFDAAAVDTSVNSRSNYFLIRSSNLAPKLPRASLSPSGRSSLSALFQQSSKTPSIPMHSPTQTACSSLPNSSVTVAP
jgi:hypothetical protein